MKLIVQIPCFNEEATLPQTVADIPREIPGIDVVEVLIIDDGSSDETVRIAREVGVDHIVRHANNKGLGLAFRTGIDACLRAGADIIVNTDGDNQYAGADIPKLIAPIVAGESDIVVGDRNTKNVSHFSATKKGLQSLGSFVVRNLSGVKIDDAVSGFRAISRDAALTMNIVSPFSYTIEMLIQAGKKRLAVRSVPISTNEKTRESRLFRSIPGFLQQSVTIMLRSYAMYRPLRLFLYISAVLMIGGLIPIVRFLTFYFQGTGGGHVQSLVLGGALVGTGFLAFLIGMLADLISFNRQLLEFLLEKMRRLEIGASQPRIGDGVGSANETEDGTLDAVDDD